MRSSIPVALLALAASLPAQADFLADPVVRDGDRLGYNLAVDEDCGVDRDRVSDTVASRIRAGGVRPIDVYVEGHEANPNRPYHLQLRAVCWQDGRTLRYMVESYWVIDTDWGWLKTYSIDATQGYTEQNYNMLDIIEQATDEAVADFLDANGNSRESLIDSIKG